MVTDEGFTEGQRIIPTLLVDSGRCVKTVGYGRRARYVGDLLNILRIFSDKGVDEIVICDRSAATRGVDVDLLAAASAEFFAPITYGGGVHDARTAERVVSAGIEKVLVTSAAVQPGVLADIAHHLGNQSVVAGLDLVRRRGAIRCAVDGARRAVVGDVVHWARRHVAAGAGEILLNATWLEGSRVGYRLDILRAVAAAVPVPITVVGGAGHPADFASAFRAGASAAAAGTMFVFFGPHDAVLPTYAGGE